MTTEEEYFENIRGTRLSSEEFREGVLSVTDYPEIRYSWATGVAITKFLAGLKEGKIMGSTCEDCDKTMCPPMMFCYECHGPMNEYVELPDTGTINTFSQAMINTDATRRDEPEFPAVIDIDGTTQTPSGILHMIDEDTDPEDLAVGAKVKAVWKDEDDRTGDINDIMYFKLMEDQ